MKHMLELAEQWIAAGKVKKAALGMLKLTHLQQLPGKHPISYVLAPYNAFNQDALALFRLAKKMGIQSIALSPFIRGRKLDEIGEDKAIAADILLRWVASFFMMNLIVKKKKWMG
jgi:aryl-alcohol dehydrogenase-like predicted oxidoreductase